MGVVVLSVMAEGRCVSRGKRRTLDIERDRWVRVAPGLERRDINKQPTAQLNATAPNENKGNVPCSSELRTVPRSRIWGNSCADSGNVSGRVGDVVVAIASTDGSILIMLTMEIPAIASDSSHAKITRT